MRIAAADDASADDEANSNEGTEEASPPDDEQGGEASPLLTAAAAGNALELKTLISQGAVALEETNQKGQAALALAAKNGSVDCVAALIAAKSSLEAADRNGTTALIEAASNGHVECVAALLKAGALPHAQDGSRQTAALLAARNGHVDCLMALVKAKPDVMNMRDSSGYTPIIWAAAVGNVDCVTALLRCNADVEAANDNGETALHVAASYERLDCVSELVKGRAKVDSTDKEGQTPLMLAAKEGHNTIVEELVKAGASVHAADKNGVTALLLAAKAGHTECVESLLRSNPKVDAPDGFEKTALMWAAAFGHAECVEILLEAGASMDAKASSGDTPFMIAVVAGNVACVQSFLSRRGPSLIFDAAERLRNVSLGSEVSRLLISSIAHTPLSSFDDPCPDGSGPYIRAFLRLAVKHLPPSRVKSSLRDLVLSQEDVLLQLFALVRALKEINFVARTSTSEKEVLDETATAVIASILDEMTKQQKVADQLVAPLFEARFGGTTLVELLLDCDLGELFLHPLLATYVHRTWRGGGTNPIDWSLPSFARFFLRDFLDGNDTNLSLKCRAWRWSDPWTHPDRPTGPFERRAPRTMWYSELTFLGAPKGRWMLESLVRLVFVALTFLFISTTSESESDPGSGSTSSAVAVGVEVSFWVFVAGYIVVEAEELRRKGWRDYFYVVWNVIDLLMLTGFLVSAAARISAAAGSPWVSWRTVLAVPALLSWVRLLELFMVHKDLGPLVLSVMGMTGDVVIFLAFFLVVLAGFVQAFLGVGLSSATPLGLSWGLLQGFLGRDTDQMSFAGLEEELPVVGPLLFFLFLAVSTILLLNLLTAQFAFTFQRVSDKSLEEYALIRARIVLDRQTAHITSPSPFNLIEVLLFPLGRFGLDVATVAVFVALSPLWILSVVLVFLVSVVLRFSGWVAARPLGRWVGRVCFGYSSLTQEREVEALGILRDLLPKLTLDQMKEDKEEDEEESEPEGSGEASDDGSAPSGDGRKRAGDKVGGKSLTKGSLVGSGTAGRRKQDEERDADGTAAEADGDGMALKDMMKLLDKVVEMEQEILNAQLLQRGAGTQGPGQGQGPAPSQKGRVASHKPLEPAALADVQRMLESVASQQQHIVALVTKGPEKKKKRFGLFKSG